jgi:recombinational DNA repair protein (RecF pathway)
MATKTKTSKTAQIAELSRQAGLLLMSAAVTMGMLELPDRSTRVVLPTQPVFAWANEKEQNQNTLRRESEETDQHYISYSVAQRTPSRSGRH